MIPKNLLIGGVTAVGSVATVAVAASEGIKYSNENQRKSAVLKKIKDNRGKVKNWLDTNKGENNWQIKIEDDGGIKELSEIDPEDLSSYLGEKTELLKSLSGEEQTTFTFRKNKSGGWENVLNREQINSWIKNTSGNKGALKLAFENQERDLKYIDDNDLNDFFESLEGKKDLWNSLKNAQENEKTVLFEKIWSRWHHTRTVIEEWLKSEWEYGGKNKFKIKIQASNGETKDLDKADENDLIGLLDYFDPIGNQQYLLEYKNPTGTEKAVLTLKRENSVWDIVQDETTVNNWVKNQRGIQTTLKRHKDGQETTPTTSAEWKALLEALKDETSISSSEETRTIIFEQIGSDLKHIKTAIKDWLESTDGGNNKLKVQIKKDNSSPATWNDSIFKDEDLVGLLKHLKEKKSTYISTTDGVQTDSSVILKKKESSNNEWEQTAN